MPLITGQTAKPSLFPRYGGCKMWERRRGCLGNVSGQRDWGHIAKDASDDRHISSRLYEVFTRRAIQRGTGKVNFLAEQPPRAAVVSSVPGVLCALPCTRCVGRTSDVRLTGGYYVLVTAELMPKLFWA